MHFDLFTILAMMLIVLLTLIGMSRSVILIAHEHTLDRILNEPYEDMKYCTRQPLLFRSAWGVILRILAIDDPQEYDDIDSIFKCIVTEINNDIKEATNNPSTHHLIPLLVESGDQLFVYRDLVERRLKLNPMLSDKYSRRRIYRILKI